MSNSAITFDDEGVYSYATLPASPNKSNSLVANFKTLLLGPRQPAQQRSSTTSAHAQVTHAAKEHRQTTAARKSKMVHSFSADATLSLLEQQPSILNEHRDSMHMMTCQFLSKRRMPPPPLPPNPSHPGHSRFLPSEYYERLSATTQTPHSLLTRPHSHVRCPTEAEAACHHIAIKEEEIDHLLHGYAPRLQRPTKSASTEPLLTTEQSLPRSARKSCLKNNNNNNNNNISNNNISNHNNNNLTTTHCPNDKSNASQPPRKTVSIQDIRSEQFAQKNYSAREGFVHPVHDNRLVTVNSLAFIASQSLAQTNPPSLFNSTDVYELIDFPYDGEEALPSSEVNHMKTAGLTALQQAARDFGATYTELDFICSSSSSSSSSCTSPHLSASRRRMSWSSSSGSSVSIEMQPMNMESLALKCNELCSVKRLANIYSTTSLSQKKNHSRQTVMTIL